MSKKWTKEEKKSQMKREAFLSILMYLGFFLWWYFTGYGLEESRLLNSGSEKIYIMGLPLWFFLSCIVGYILFCIASILAVRCFFKDFSFDDTPAGDDREKNIEHERAVR